MNENSLNSLKYLRDLPSLKDGSLLNKKNLHTLTLENLVEEESIIKAIIQKFAKYNDEIEEHRKIFFQPSKPENIQQEILKLYASDDPKENLRIAKTLELFFEGQKVSLKTNAPITYGMATALQYIQTELDRPQGIPFPNEFQIFNIDMYPGLLTTIGAYSGVGKSTFLLNIVLDQIKKKKHTVFYTLEMTPGQLWLRIFGQYKRSLSNVQTDSQTIYETILKHRTDDRELTSFLDEFSNYLLVVDAQKWTAKEIIGHYENLVNSSKEPTCVFIDYLQIIAPENNQSEKRQEIITIMDNITTYAKETKSAWILAAQTNRTSHALGNNADHSSFQESARIEQDSALSLILSRIELEEGERQLESEYYISCNISKNRFGRTTKTKFTVDAKTGYILGQAPDDIQSQKGKKK